MKNEDLKYNMGLEALKANYKKRKAVSLNISDKYMLNRLYRQNFYNVYNDTNQNKTTLDAMQQTIDVFNDYHQDGST